MDRSEDRAECLRIGARRGIADKVIGSLCVKKDAGLHADPVTRDDRPSLPDLVPRPMRTAWAPPDARLEIEQLLAAFGAATKAVTHSSMSSPIR